MLELVEITGRHGVEGLRLVEKPFDAETLLSAVRSALAGAPREFH